MSARMRMRRLLAPRSRSTTLVALLVIGLAAVRVLGPGWQDGEGHATTIGGLLAVGLLILTSAHGAGLARRALRRSRGDTGRTLRRLARLASMTFLEGMRGAALCAPVLIVGWELGASGRRLAMVGLGAMAAAACGTLLGLLLGALGATQPAGGMAAAALGALILWPGSLRWTASSPGGFPGPELPPVAMATAFLIVALLCAAAAVFQRRLGDR